MLCRILDLPLVGAVLEWSLISMFLAVVLIWGFSSGLGDSIAATWVEVNAQPVKARRTFMAIGISLGALAWASVWIMMGFVRSCLRADDANCKQPEPRLSTIRMQHMLYVLIRVPLFVFLALQTPPFVVLAFSLELLPIALGGAFFVSKRAATSMRKQVLKEYHAFKDSEYTRLYSKP